MAVCCTNELSEYDSMENTAYLEYVARKLLKFGCSTDEGLSCSEDNVDMWLRVFCGEEGVGSIVDCCCYCLRVGVCFACCRR